MTYVNTLNTYTSLTTPASSYATSPACVCDFGWFDSEAAATFGSLIYDVAGNTYPPAGAHFQDYITGVNKSVTFDVYDINNLGLPTVIVPPNIFITAFLWDLGNGQTASGPLATTTYTQPTPDGAVTLTITDSLGRVTSTTHRLNFVDLIGVSGGLRVVS